MNIANIFLKIVLTLGFIGVLFGFVLPTLVSAKSTASVIGAVILVVGLVYLALHVIQSKFSKKNNENNK